MLMHIHAYRTLVYVEGEASMRKFETKDGRADSALSIVQRMYLPSPPFFSQPSLTLVGFHRPFKRITTNTFLLSPRKTRSPPTTRFSKSRK